MRQRTQITVVTGWSRSWSDSFPQPFLAGNGKIVVGKGKT